MKEYEFKLTLALADMTTDGSLYIKSLAEAGCDDALIGIGRKGRIALEFCRESENAIEAVISALKDIQRAIPDAKLIEASPDLVGITDIASLIGVSRQNIRKLMLNNYSTFPIPFHEGKSSIWHLADILNWFLIDNRRSIEPKLIEIAFANMQLNLAKENQQVDVEYEKLLKPALLKR